MEDMDLIMAACARSAAACHARSPRAPGQGRDHQQQPGRVAGASLHHRDLSAQVLHLGNPRRVERPGLDRDRQPERRIQRARVALGPGCRKQALRPATGFGRQHRRAFQERGRLAVGAESEAWRAVSGTTSSTAVALLIVTTAAIIIDRYHAAHPA